MPKEQYHLARPERHQDFHRRQNPASPKRGSFARSGDRPLALDIAKPKESFAQRLARIWKRDIAYVFNVARSQRESARRQAEIIQHSEAIPESQVSETTRPPQTVRQARPIAPKQNQTRNHLRGGIGV
jgi:hypothetical protein